MAAGDAAGAAGLYVYTGNELANQLWIRDNERGDEIAAVMTATRPVATGGTGGTDQASGRAGLGIPAILGADVTASGGIPTYSPALTLAVGAPTQPYHATTKAYVDGKAIPADPFFHDVHVSGAVFTPNAFGATSGYSVAYINGDGRLSRGTSSRRYKKNLRAWDPDPSAVLKLSLTEFEYRVSVDPDAPTDQGLIAEDVADLGLEWLVLRDADGRPDGVRYERLALGLLAVVQDLSARVAELEGKAA